MFEQVNSLAQKKDIEVELKKGTVAYDANLIR